MHRLKSWPLRILPSILMSGPLRHWWTSSTPPGESDHQTGLGLDITDRYYSTMDASQMDQNFLTWLRENCADYGFILRYPSDKSAITERDEPWHFRYVGVEAARYIMDNNLCLEQFIALYE